MDLYGSLDDDRGNLIQVSLLSPRSPRLRVSSDFSRHPQISNPMLLAVARIFS